MELNFDHMKKRIVILLLTLPGLLLWNGCTSENKYNLPEQISGSVSDELLDELTSLGFPIHSGDNPPCIEGIYLATPFTLKGSNVPSEGLPVGYIFPDFELKLYNQNSEDLTIELDYVNATVTGNGIGGFICGEGDYFSLFAITTSVKYGYTAEVLWVFSGKMTANGIEEFHAGNFMLNDNGDPGDVFIPNNSGRTFYDGSLNYLTDCISGDCGSGCPVDLELDLTMANFSGVWYYVSLRTVDYIQGTDQTINIPYGDVKWEYFLNGNYTYNDSPLIYTSLLDGTSVSWKWEVLAPNTFRIYNTHPELVSLNQHQTISEITILNNTDLEVVTEYSDSKEYMKFKR